MNETRVSFDSEIVLENLSVCLSVKIFCQFCFHCADNVGKNIKMRQKWKTGREDIGLLFL